MCEADRINAERAVGWGRPSVPLDFVLDGDIARRFAAAAGWPAFGALGCGIDRTSWPPTVHVVTDDGQIACCQRLGHREAEQWPAVRLCLPARDAACATRRDPSRG
jgi:hypothetical protein